MRQMVDRGLHIKGRIGTWYVVETMWYDGREILALESEVYGDEADWIFVEKDTLVELPDSVSGAMT